MKYLVTGGAGFIASHLCERLLETSKVVCVDNLSIGKKDNIKPGVDFELKLFQATDAKQGNRGFDFALGLDTLVFPFKKYLIIKTLQKKTLILQQMGAVDINGVVQRIAFFRNSVDIDNHWFLFFQFKINRLIFITYFSFAVKQTA